MPSAARHLTVPTAVVAVGAWAWVVTGLRPFSAAATVAVVGSGALVAVVPITHIVDGTEAADPHALGVRRT